ncbi:hypothetical protein [Actinokineospora diospyrosa]|uniref:Dynamin family protein n=1 Tax=Actinokineospora diospyrosa TaxID=103728 RepID=A0ABT1IIX3_9PSEU|nr:hypothetical protein [Actinokineospora diospyrosa]MCP2272597.1 Dynamin family protein [Actinokineospora diospyrosa]
MDHVVEIARLRAKAVAVGEELIRLEPPADLQDLVRTAWQRQRDLHLVAHRDPTAALAGGVTAGKSLLASLLVDVPGLLFSTNAPATGNPTRIRLARGSGPTSVTRRRVTLLTAEAVAELVEHILAGIIAEARRMNGGRDTGSYDVRGLLGCRPVDPTDVQRSDWSAVTAFFEPRWNTDALDPSLKEWGVELFAIRDALRVAGHLLPTNPGTGAEELDAETMVAALEIGDQRMAGAGFSRHRSMQPLLPDQLATVTGLRAVFPLIHEVIVDVAVDPAVCAGWALPMALIDLPGTTANSRRDQYLTLSELRTTTVLAVVMNAAEPANKELGELVRALTEGRHGAPADLVDSIVVLANKADRLNPPGYAVGSVSDLVASSEDLRTLNDEVGKLTRGRPEQVALVSALAVALTAGHQPQGARHEDAAAAREQVRRWGRIVNGLVQDHPMAAALAAIGDDGGLGRVRELVVGQTTGPGLGILVRLAQAHEAELDAVLVRLRRSSPRTAANEHERSRLVSLVADLRVAQRVYSAEADRVPALSTLPHGSSTVDAELVDLVVAEVDGWPLWPATLSTAWDFGVGRSRPPRGPGRRPGRPGKSGRPRADRAENHGVVTTTEILASYTESRSVVRYRADALLVEAVREWASRLHGRPEVAAVVARLSSPDRELLADRLPLGIGHDAADNCLELLTELVDLELATEFAKHHADTAAPHTGDPLEGGRALPWDPTREKRSGTITDLADLVTAERLRRDLSAALVHEVRLRSRYVLNEVFDNLAEFARELNDILPTHREIDRMVNPPEGAEA